MHIRHALENDAVAVIAECLRIRPEQLLANRVLEERCSHVISVERVLSRFEYLWHVRYSSAEVEPFERKGNLRGLLNWVVWQSERAFYNVLKSEHQIFRGWCAHEMTRGPARLIPPHSKLWFRSQLRDRKTVCRSKLHGFGHWRGVSWLSQILASRLPGADPVVTVLFGLFHDLERHNDGADPEHGPRAADLLDAIGSTRLGLSDSQLAALCLACRDHSAGRVHIDPTVASCWDADRLTLWRCRIAPRPEFLSPQIGSAPTLLMLGRIVALVPPLWSEVFEPVLYWRRLLQKPFFSEPRLPVLLRLRDADEMRKVRSRK